MSHDKEVDEVVSVMIVLVNNQYSLLAELMCILTVVFAQKSLAKKSF